MSDARTVEMSTPVEQQTLAPARGLILVHPGTLDSTDNGRMARVTLTVIFGNAEEIC